MSSYFSIQEAILSGFPEVLLWEIWSGRVVLKSQVLFWQC